MAGSYQKMAASNKRWRCGVVASPACAASLPSGMPAAALHVQELVMPPAIRHWSIMLMVSAACLGGAGCRNASAPGAREAAGSATHPAAAGAPAWRPEPGSTTLFTGTDLSGWHYRGDPDLGTATEASDGRYSAREGMLVVNPEVVGRGPHLRQLWTMREFPSDFVLKLEFRAAVDADSGIFIRGMQLQCRDYLVAGPFKELKAYKPQDWNEIVIVVTGRSALCTCNGEVLHVDLAVPANGPIGLEADRGRMEYRRIRLAPR
jgi:hypothetical protein